VKPIIRTPDTTDDKREANKLTAILKRVVDDMDEDAWPEDCGQVTILVLNPGESDYSTSTPSLITTFQYNDTDLSAIVRREPGTTSEIHVNTEFFKTGAGARMVKLLPSKILDYWTKERIYEVAFHFLAHETHHLNEIERMAKCGVLRESCLSALASAARPDFPAQWKSALLGLTDKYPDKLPASLIKAGHIANEASADLLGLYWMSVHDKFKSTWRNFANYLVAFRRGAYTDWLRKKKADPKSTVPEAYDIADALESIVMKGIPTIQAIYEETWELSRNLILLSEDVDSDVRTLFTHDQLPHLKLPEK